MTIDLLKLAIEAHGGLARWNAFRTLEAEMSITGGIWHVKQKPDIFRHVVAANIQARCRRNGYASPAY